MTPDALVALLQLASAASPVGSYAYSDGLETAVHRETVRDEHSAQGWIEGLLRHGLGPLDLVLLRRMHGAWDDRREAAALADSAWLLACRETAELRSADRRQGGALMRVADALGVADAQKYRRDQRVSYACAFAYVGSAMGIDADACALGYGYAWVENTVQVAVKLVPLGQGAGQRMTRRLGKALVELGDDAAAEMSLDAIAAGAPGQALASALHERLATRLYRS